MAKFDWNKMYALLDGLIDQLKVPRDDVSSIREAIRVMQKVEIKTLRIANQMSRHLADAKEEYTRTQVTYSLSLKQLLADPDIQDQLHTAVNAKQKQLMVEAMLVEEQKQLDDARDLVEKIKAFLACVERVLQTTKHHREDVSKQLKLIDIQREVG